MKQFHVILTYMPRYTVTQTKTLGFCPLIPLVTLFLDWKPKSAAANEQDPFVRRLINLIHNAVTFRADDFGTLLPVASAQSFPDSV